MKTLYNYAIILFLYPLPHAAILQQTILNDILANFRMKLFMKVLTFQRLEYFTEKGKLVVMSKFSFCHGVFKIRLMRKCRTAFAAGKGLSSGLTPIQKIFQQLFSHITAASLRSHVLADFLTPVLNTTLFPSNWLLSSYSASPLVEDESRLSHWLFSDVEKSVVWTGIRIHNPGLTAACVATEAAVSWNCLPFGPHRTAPCVSS